MRGPRLPADAASPRSRPRRAAPCFPPSSGAAWLRRRGEPASAERGAVRGSRCALRRRPGPGSVGEPRAGACGGGRGGAGARSRAGRGRGAGPSARAGPGCHRAAAEGRGHTHPGRRLPSPAVGPRGRPRAGGGALVPGPGPRSRSRAPGRAGAGHRSGRAGCCPPRSGFHFLLRRAPPRTFCGGRGRGAELRPRRGRGRGQGGQLAHCPRLGLRLAARGGSEPASAALPVPPSRRRPLPAVAAGAAAASLAGRSRSARGAVVGPPAGSSDRGGGRDFLCSFVFSPLEVRGKRGVDDDVIAVGGASALTPTSRAPAEGGGARGLGRSRVGAPRALPPSRAEVLVSSCRPPGEGGVRSQEHLPRRADRALLERACARGSFAPGSVTPRPPWRTSWRRRTHPRGLMRFVAGMCWKPVFTPSRCLLDTFLSLKLILDFENSTYY